MVAAVILLTIMCAFNIIMWTVFLARFKKLFGAEDVVDETRQILNNMLRDMNNNADRNINLLEKKIQELKEVSKEADKHILLLNKELEQKTKEKIFYSELSADEKNIRKKSQGKYINPAQRYLDEQKQGRLFEENESSPVQKSRRKSSEKATEKSAKKTNDSIKSKADSSKKNVIQDVPEYTKSADPIVPKKTVKQRIHELHKKGKSDSEIAYELGLSLQEVKFSLEIP